MLLVQRSDDGTSCTNPMDYSSIKLADAEELDGIDFCTNGGQALGVYGECT